MVIDNASGDETKEIVKRYSEKGAITKLKLLDYNSLFAKGNNIASSMASPSSTHFLLLNSDVEIKHPDWLRRLLDNHKRGASSLERSTAS